MQIITENEYLLFVFLKLILTFKKMFYCWSVVLFVIRLSIRNGIYQLLSHRCSVYAFNDTNGCGEAEWSQRHLQLNKMIGHSCLKRTFSSLPLSLSLLRCIYLFIWGSEWAQGGTEREREILADSPLSWKTNAGFISRPWGPWHEPKPRISCLTSCATQGPHIFLSYVGGKIICHSYLV